MSMKVKDILGISLFLVCLCVLRSGVASAINSEDVRVRQEVLIESAWGSKDGEFGKWPDAENGISSESAYPLAVDNRGNIYVADSINYRVEKFSKYGRYVSEIKLKQDGSVPIIRDIAVDKYGNVYIALASGHAIAKYSNSFQLMHVYDLASSGAKKQAEGAIKQNDRRQIIIQKIRINADASSIYVLDSMNDYVFKINAKGDVVQHWGPWASNAMRFMFLDDKENLYIGSSSREDISKYKRYDKFGKLIGNGLGKFENILWPYYVDSAGYVYGIDISKESFIARYDEKKNKLSKLPISYPLIGFEESWTVDDLGNIYYSQSKGDKFEILKMLIIR